ncbi:MAG: pyridoxal-phosphate dependent enzyme [bacterium]
MIPLNTDFEKNAILQRIVLPGIDDEIIFYMKRIDLVHPKISGNKWFKMKYNIAEAMKEGYETILTFGGAFSNHVHATAAAGKIFGFKTIGMIRGEEYSPLNPTLQSAADNGMELHYLNRKTYRHRNEQNFISEIAKQFPGSYILPEGGSNKFAIKGCKEIPQSIEINFDYICSAVGTGGTISGIISGLKENQNALGFSALKNGNFLSDAVNKFLNDATLKSCNNWSIITDYHFGGYAKINHELVEFVNEFERANNIPLDYIYTAKMMYGIFDLARTGFFKNGSTIIAVHTGGLQGNLGMKNIVAKVM